MHLMIYIHYKILFSKNDNFKYTRTPQRVTFNSFSLFHIFLFVIFFLVIFFQTLMHKETSSLYYISHVLHFEFLICNILNSVRNMYCWTFLRGLFLLLFPKVISAVANESLIPYNLVKKTPCFFLDRKLVFIDLKLGTHTK